MQRRKFIAAAAAALPLGLSAAPFPPSPAAGERQLIELRTYEIKFGGSGQRALREYLAQVLSPALEKLGCPAPKLLKELGNSEPANLWLLIAYPDAETYVQAQQLEAGADFLAASKTYDAIPPGQPIYNRYASQLMLAFTGMPEVAFPGPEAGLFELRTYEGYSEDAVRRKTAMFNDEEIVLFHEVGLHPVFFGKMIAGPYRPSLVYMLHFRDMEERNANWSTFGNHPDWKAMLQKEKYANTVSNIRKTFLVPG